MTSAAPSISSPATGSVRVPDATPFFWILKILTTGFGESFADLVQHHIGPKKALLLFATLLIGAVAWHMRQGRYRVWPYWLTVVLVANFGTVLADVLAFRLGVPLTVSNVVFAVGLAAVFLLWWRSEGTLSIHSVDTNRRELFYWAAVILTFALGTAVGDLSAGRLGLGYLGSGIFYIGLILLPALGYLKFGLGPVLAFWASYIVTRPLGASFADWMAFPENRGGLNLGLALVSAVLGVLILGLVALMARRRAL